MIPIPAAKLPRTNLDHLFSGSVTIHNFQQVTVNGTILSPGAIQRLAGCPAGGDVYVDVNPARILLTSTHDTHILDAKKQKSKNKVEIRLDATGQFLYPDYIRYAKPGQKGLGPVAFLLMAWQAHTLNMKRIDLLAAGGTGIKYPGLTWGEEFWGYEVWPRMGFDCALQPPILALIQNIPHLASCTHVSQIVARDPAWWKLHGDGWDMSFNLTPDSDSWDTLYHFCLNRGLLT